MAIPTGRIHCLNPNHKDSTPSLVVYSTGDGYCFGCGSSFPAVGPVIQAPPTLAEDLDTELDRIKLLPTKMHRGLSLPFDNTGYYLVWGGDIPYYKCRLWLEPDDGRKYRCPRGHAQPLFLANANFDSKLLVICEGEFNALSLAQCLTGCFIVSPGGVGNFRLKKIINSLPHLHSFATILLVVDSDPPGFNAAVSMREEILARGTLPSPLTKIWLMPEDANSILVTKGRSGLKEEAERMGLR